MSRSPQILPSSARGQPASQHPTHLIVLTPAHCSSVGFRLFSACSMLAARLRCQALRLLAPSSARAISGGVTCCAGWRRRGILLFRQCQDCSGEGEARHIRRRSRRWTNACLTKETDPSSRGSWSGTPTVSAHCTEQADLPERGMLDRGSKGRFTACRTRETCPCNWNSRLGPTSRRACCRHRPLLGPSARA